MTSERVVKTVQLLPGCTIRNEHGDVETWPIAGVPSYTVFHAELCGAYWSLWSEMTPWTARIGLVHAEEFMYAITDAEAAGIKMVISDASDASAARAEVHKVRADAPSDIISRIQQTTLTGAWVDDYFKECEAKYGHLDKPHHIEARLVVEVYSVMQFVVVKYAEYTASYRKGQPLVTSISIPASGNIPCSIMVDASKALIALSTGYVAGDHDVAGGCMLKFADKPFDTVIPIVSLKCMMSHIFACARGEEKITSFSVSMTEARKQVPGS